MKQIFTLIFLFALSLSSTFAQTAPDFTFTDIDGESHSLSDALAENKVILLDFFFVDCGPCQQWAPEIDAIIEDFEGTTLEIWAISDRDYNAYIQASIFNSTHEHHKVGGVQGGGNDILNLFDANFTFKAHPSYSIICSDGSITWDIWPISTGANEIRNQLTEDCGVTELSSSTSAIEGLKAVQVFPNPASDNITVEFDLATSTTMAIEVYNTLGQKVKSIQTVAYATGAQTVNVDVSDLTEGLYVLKMQSDEGLNSLDFVVTK